MEKRHKQRPLENFGEIASAKEIIILDIPDEYQYLDEELIEILRLSIDQYLT